MVRKAGSKRREKIKLLSVGVFTNGAFVGQETNKEQSSSLRGVPYGTTKPRWASPYGLAMTA
jgi:hypothetical protein